MGVYEKEFSQMLARCQRTARLGMFLSVAAVLHVIEAQLPSLPLPGARLGLANLVSVLVIYIWGWREGLLIALLRQVLGGLFTGALLGPPFWFGLVGSLLSVSVMGNAVTLGFSSPVQVSILGAVAHNLGQLAVAYALIRQPAVLNYWPFLLLLALPSGAAVGYLAKILLPHLREDHGEKETQRAKGGPLMPRLGAGAALVLFVFAVVWPLRPHAFMRGNVSEPGVYAEVSIDGRPVQQLPLHLDTDYAVPLAKGHMTVAIRAGSAAVIASSCPDQICVRMGRITRPPQAVICVPNRVVVRIIGESETDIDAVSG